MPKPNGYFANTERCIKERDELRQWVHDLQSGMYINCVYCGHRYGPKDKVPCTMAEVLKKHIELCPKHPMSALKAERDELLKGLWELLSWAVIRQDTSHQLLPLLPEGHPLRKAAELIEHAEERT